MLFSLVTLSFQAVFMKSYCAFLSLFSMSTLSFSSYIFSCFFMPQCLFLAHCFFKCTWKVEVKCWQSGGQGEHLLYILCPAPELAAHREVGILPFF